MAIFRHDQNNAFFIHGGELRLCHLQSKSHGERSLLE